VEFENLKND